MELKLGIHRQDVSDCKLWLLVAGPMQRGATFVVHLVDIHVLDDRKVIKWYGLVALSSNVEAICTIHVCNIDIGPHFIHH